MADLGGVDEALKSAVDRWEDLGDGSEVNEYLDAEGLAHQQVTMHGKSESPPEGVVGDCGPGYHGAWVKTKNGTWWSTCVPD